MSRHEIRARDQALSAVVGWDNPLQTFFAQVARPERADDEDDDDPMLLWVGTEPGEVTTVESSPATSHRSRISRRRSPNSSGRIERPRFGNR